MAFLRLLDNDDKQSMWAAIDVDGGRVLLVVTRSTGPCTNLTGFLQALQKIGYEDALSVEIFGRGLKNYPPEVAAKMGLDASLAVFKKAGVKQGGR